MKLDFFADVFSQISDSNGHLALTRFSEYLQEVLALPAAVFESPSFAYSDNLATHIFDGVRTSDRQGYCKFQIFERF